MAGEIGDAFGFAPAHDAPIPYMQRTRDYYAALGYGEPYAWAHYAAVPFRRPARWRRAASPSSRQRPPISPTKATRDRAHPITPPLSSTRSIPATAPATHDLRISHIAIDRQHTTAEDPGTYFPLPALQRAAERGRIGALAPRFHGLPTNRSHRVTLETDCPEIVARCKADQRRCGDPGPQLPGLPSERQPRGTPARGGGHRDGGDGLRQGHRRICRRAALPVLRLPARQQRRPPERSGVAGLDAGACAAASREPRPRRGPPSSRRCVWSDSPDWKLDYCNIARLQPEEIARRRADFDGQKRVARSLRDEAGTS